MKPKRFSQTQKMITDGSTVKEAQARTFMELVQTGKSVPEAAKEIGTTIEALRTSGQLAKVCRELIERNEEAKLLDKAVREKLVKAKLTELLMQDDDPKISLGAARAIQNELGIGQNQINVGVAVQANLKYDPGVIEALKSLQLEDKNDGSNSQI